VSNSVQGELLMTGSERELRNRRAVFHFDMKSKQHGLIRRVFASLPLLLILLATGCYTSYKAPGAVGRVVDAETGAPIRGARVTRPAIKPPSFFDGVAAASAVTDKTGTFNLPPASDTQILFMVLPNPESLESAFIVSAEGYVTNELHGSATSRTLWRVQLGKTLLGRP
jgi:hypothetical protein